MAKLDQAVASRRTFAIISHPDAGKTTLTEKLLLFGGAIQMAGAVKARGNQRRAHSDWMKVERERGISVTSSVMTFEHDGLTFNQLDTPGHEDFSEDTYRTLTAVDSVIMVIDAAKGIEAQTRKLFEVCRLRDIPIITFINKLDREARDSFDLSDEIEQTLALDVTPASWPIGMGRNFLGCFDILKDRLLMAPKGRASGAATGEADTIIACHGLDDPELDAHLPDYAAKQLRDDVEMARGLCQEFDVDDYRAGHLSPVYFGSAINNFGVRELLRGLVEKAPPPGPWRSALFWMFRAALAEAILAVPPSPGGLGSWPWGWSVLSGRLRWRCFGAWPLAPVRSRGVFQTARCQDCRPAGRPCHPLPGWADGPSLVCRRRMRHKSANRVWGWLGVCGGLWA